MTPAYGTLPEPSGCVQVLDRITSRETGYLDVQQGDRVALLVNSLGSTTPMELSIVARAALTQLRDTHKVRALYTCWLNREFGPTHKVRAFIYCWLTRRFDWQLPSVNPA